MKKTRLQRILIELGIDFDIFVENIVQKDGSVFKFKLALAYCNTDKQIKSLIGQYI